MLGWLIRNPYRSAVLIGIAIALLFGWASFPREQTIERTISGWLPENLVGAGPARTQLLDVLEAFNSGDQNVATRVSEEEFRELEPAQAYAAPAVKDGQREFHIQYVGSKDGETYVAEKKVSPGSSLDIDRIAYKALEAETDQASNVLRLTFERDVTGLITLLLIDLIVGGFYGAVIGMILGVLGLEQLDKKHAPRPIPGPKHALPGGDSAFRV
jgi:hypothetical protein